MHEIKEIVTLKQVVKKIDFSIRKVASSFQLAMWLEEEIGNESQEVLVLFCLNKKNEINSYSVVHRGTLDQSILHPRDIFSRAILSNASSIVIAHNHPSNSVQPSTMDDIATKRIKECSELLGIKLLDHLIVGTDQYYSYVEENKLKKGDFIMDFQNIQTVKELKQALEQYIKNLPVTIFDKDYGYISVAFKKETSKSLQWLTFYPNFEAKLYTVQTLISYLSRLPEKAIVAIQDEIKEYSPLFLSVDETVDNQQKLQWLVISDKKSYNNFFFTEIKKKSDIQGQAFEKMLK